MNKADVSFHMLWANTKLAVASKGIARFKASPTKHDLPHVRRLHRAIAAHLNGARRALHE